MSVADRARERGITEILHYTSQKGVQGSVMKGAVLSRKRTENDEDVAYIFEGVWPVRAPAWVDYISLSISRINSDLYGKSRARYPDWWWAVMSFSPDILDHEGVWFTTTNNVYEEVLERGQGVEGFEALFQERVPWGYWGSVSVRSESHPRQWPTNRQAEVLYPGELSFEHLLRVYVPGAEHRALVLAWCEAFERPEFEVVVDAAVFS
jgi:hypothetical protein